MNAQHLVCRGCNGKFVRAGALIQHIEQSQCSGIGKQEFFKDVEYKSAVARTLNGEDEEGMKMTFLGGKEGTDDEKAVDKDENEPTPAEPRGITSNSSDEANGTEEILLNRTARPWLSSRKINESRETSNLQSNDAQESIATAEDIDGKDKAKARLVNELENLSLTEASDERNWNRFYDGKKQKFVCTYPRCL